MPRTGGPSRAASLRTARNSNAPVVRLRYPPAIGRGQNWELERFVERADRLRHTRLIQNGFSAELSYTFGGYGSSANTIQGRLKQPNEDDLKSFLLDFRPFTLQRDSVYLGRVYNRLEQCLTNTARRDALRASREGWKQGQRHVGIQFFINEQEVTPELAIDLYVNGWYFHDDPDKRQRLEALTVGHGQILTRWVFLEALRATIMHVLIVAKVTKDSLADGSLPS